MVGIGGEKRSVVQPEREGHHGAGPGKKVLPRNAVYQKRAGHGHGVRIFQPRSRNHQMELPHRRRKRTYRIFRPPHKERKMGDQQHDDQRSVRRR